MQAFLVNSSYSRDLLDKIADLVQRCFLDLCLSWEREIEEIVLLSWKIEGVSLLFRLLNVGVK